MSICSLVDKCVGSLWFGYSVYCTGSIHTGEHLIKGPKNLSRVYRYFTLSLASLAASVILLSYNWESIPSGCNIISTHTLQLLATYMRCPNNTIIDDVRLMLFVMNFNISTLDCKTLVCDFFHFLFLLS